MKNKIKQFSKGDFKMEQPDIQFSETQLLMSVGEGEIYEGSFTIVNNRDGNIRGLIYPSSFRVHILEEGFDSNPVKVNFTYDSTGMVPGDMDQGKFTVVCNGGEFDLDYRVVIEKPFIMTSYGKIQSIADFKKLAMQDFIEAQRLFRSRQFYDILKYEDIRIRNLYDNMRKWSLDEQALEEFLVGIKQKEKLFLSLSEEKADHTDILENQKSSITITKNTWGYAPIRVETNGDFIDVYQKAFTTDDFIGNSYELEYLVLSEKLHAGYNFCEIIVSTPYETIKYEVSVRQSGKRDEMRGMKGMVAGQGLKEYLAFIAGKTNVDEWVQKATRRVDQLKELEPDSEYYALLQAHIYLRAGRDEEARWILENGSFSKFAIGRKPEISAYYLFLTALLRKEALHTTRVLEDLNRSFMKHLYSWPILCMIINLDIRYRDYNERLRVLERQFFNGANQILLYAEAYLCFQEKVPLLRKLDSFEVQIMNFATKYKIITRELALHLADLVCQQKKFDAKLLRILERAYEMYEEPRILTAICMQLIKGDKAGASYFKWYQNAVAQGIKIAQLYEYYMMSVHPARVRSAFPRMIYLYFLHGINLDYRQTALLYENILTYESEDGEIYKQYKEQMEAFAKEHLLKRHISDSFRMLYNRFIHPNNISLEEEDAIYDICHAYQVTTDVPGMKYVLVIEKDGTIRQRVPYKVGYGAQIYLYNKEARIVWEADNGIHYSDSISYESIRLFYEMRFVELCKNRTKGQEAYEAEQHAVSLSMETLQQYGMSLFESQDIFMLCTRQIREQQNEESDFMLYLCFELLKEGYYDKATLHYLAQFYCGSTPDMKLVWSKAREYGVNTKALAERIITQMLFSEVVFNEEEIFEDYYVGKPYFRLKQAYLAYVSRLYVISERVISEKILTIIMKEYVKQEYLADICKVALLKYYVDKQYDVSIGCVLRECLADMCERHMVFPFYLSYPQPWLKEMQLYDKVMIQYCGTHGGKVKVIYRIQNTNELPAQYVSEILLPVFDNVYVKEFVLYGGEYLEYYFEEILEEQTIVSDKTICKKTEIVYEDGKYGRLNLISRLSADNQYEAMLHYKKEEELANEFFQTY